MSQHVLVPVDGSRPSRAAIEYASEQFPDARLMLLYVIDPMADYSRTRAYPGYTADDEYKSEREKGDAVLETLEGTLPDAVDVETALEAGNPIA